MRKSFEVSQSIEIGAMPETCYRVICDFESYPHWFTYVKDVQVRERDEAGEAVLVWFIFDIAFKHGLRIHQRFERDPLNYTLSFTAVGGDFTDAQGHFRFLPLTGGRTDARYYLKIAPGMFLPPKLVNYLIDRVLRQALEMVKSESERAERLFFR